VLRGEIAQDRVGFPQGEAVVLDGRHEAVRVLLEIFRLVVPAERPADILAVIFDPEFAA
jgi:hypothetical protein